MAIPASTQAQAASTAPKLTRRAEFEAVLKDYKVSEEGLKILRDTPMLVLVGPTAGGRNTIIRELLKTGKYRFIVSDTTRPPRQNNGVWERNGVQYFFRAEEGMLNDLKNGMFVEAELIHNQQVSGTSIREIKRAQDEGKVAIGELEILGSINIAKLKPDAKFVYLAPPSFEEWMNRIHGRSELSTEELRNRLCGAVKNFRLALENDFFTFAINKDLADTVRFVDRLAAQNVHPNKEDEFAARQVVRELWEQTEEYLKTL